MQAGPAKKNGRLDSSPAGQGFTIRIEGHCRHRLFPVSAGVVGPFGGEETAGAALRESRFISVTLDNLDEILAGLRPALRLELPNKIDGSGGRLLASIRFLRLADFEPGNLARQIPPIRRLCELRDDLRNLRAILSPVLEKWLADLLVESFHKGIPEDLEKQLAAAGIGHNEFERGLTAKCVRTVATEMQAGRLEPGDSLTAALGRQIGEVDAIINRQVAEVLADQNFRKLEAAWKGLHLLLSRLSPYGSAVHVRILPASGQQLRADAHASDIQYSTLWQLIVDGELNCFGGQPFDVLVLDGEFGRSREDTETLEHLGQICASSITLLLTGAADSMYAVASNQHADEFSQSDWFVLWRALVASEAARFLCVLLPRVPLRTGETSQLSVAGAYALAASLVADLVGDTASPLRLVWPTLSERAIAGLEELGVQTAGMAGAEGALGPREMERLQTLAAERYSVRDVLAVCRALHGLRAIVREKAETLDGAEVMERYARQWFDDFAGRVSAARGFETWAEAQIAARPKDDAPFGTVSLDTEVRVTQPPASFRVGITCYTDRLLLAASDRFERWGE